MTFLSGTFRGSKHLVDMACGTGTYSEQLAALGFKVTGMDLDVSMIDVALEGHSAAGVRYLAGDMATGVSLVGDPFDGLYCIGNSVVHLESKNRVRKSLSAWHDSMVSGGKLVLQIVNFNRFAQGVETELPAIRHKGLAFERRYVPASADKVSFATKLHLRDDPAVYENAVELLILKSEELVAMLEETGYTNIRLFGGYEGQEYSPEESFLAVFIATT